MLPLVQRVVKDIIQFHRVLAELQPEQERLDRQRHTLAWPERSRRYQIQEEVAFARRQLQAALDELAALAVVVLDPIVGRVGFPTIVNNREAFFSWQFGDKALSHWQFADDATRRLIPASWAKAANIRLTSKS
jgi:hypothetical protein